MRDRLRIGIDVDGCVYNWTRAVNEGLVQKYGIPDPGEHIGWDYLQKTITKQQWEWVWSSDASEMIFGRLDLIFPGAKEAVNELCRDHEVHFVTHRNPRRVTGITGRWLNYHFRNYAGVHVINGRCEKRTLGHWDVFIDDKPETIWGFVNNGDETLLLVPQRPWNKELWGNGLTFKEWAEVPRILKERMI